jgi:hypothetical protein
MAATQGRDTYQLSDERNAKRESERLPSRRRVAGLAESLNKRLEDRHRLLRGVQGGAGVSPVGGARVPARPGSPLARRCW